MRVYTLVKLDTKRNEKDLYTLAFVLALTPFRKLRRFTTASAFVCFNKKFHYEVLTRSEREKERKRENVILITFTEYKISFYKMIIKYINIFSFEKYPSRDYLSSKNHKKRNPKQYSHLKNIHVGTLARRIET